MQPVTSFNLVARKYKVPNLDKPEITNYKHQITNKLQNPNLKIR